MKLRFVNRVGDFLKQLHANMTEQPFAVVEDPVSATGKSGCENASSSMMCTFGQTAVWFRLPIHLQHEIDSAAQPGHGNRLTSPSGSGAEPSVDGTRLNGWSVPVSRWSAVLGPLTSILRLVAPSGLCQDHNHEAFSSGLSLSDGVNSSEHAAD